MSWLREAFDLRSGIYAALLMGGIVAYANSAHGPLPATTAGLKQASYTFFMGGFVMRFSEWLAQRRGPAALAIASAVFLPCCLTIGCTFFIHSLRGTPEPIASTIPVAAISLPTFVGWALKSRKAVAADPDDEAVRDIANIDAAATRAMERL